MEQEYFYEEQRYNQRWLWLILILVGALLVALGLVILLKLKTGPGVAVVPFGGACLSLVVFRLMRLDCKITDDTIAYRFFPIQRRFRTIPKADIRRCEVITYNTMRDYGGWGISY